MKKLIMLVAAFMVLSGAFAGMFSGVGFAAQKAMTYSGEIWDSDCAKMGKHPDPDSAMCTTDCIKSGAKYVLFNAAAKTIYQLDDQKQPAQFAGKKVVVTGTLDSAKKTIHVTGIKAGA
jgi:hypothetical protein